MDNNNLFPPPAPDFSDPLGLLRACHERISQHCALLERLAKQFVAQGADLEVRETAAKIHRYFSTAAKHHHTDEEKELFPRLARQSLKLAESVHSLKQEHERLNELWHELEPLLSRPASITDITAFTHLAETFATAHRNHMAQENEELLDLAQHIFGSDELKQIGRHMAERRGINLPANF